MALGLSVVDYLVFAASLLMCAGAGIYYLIVEKRKKRRNLQHHHHHHHHHQHQHPEQQKELQATVDDDDNQEATTKVTSAREYFLGNRHLSFWPTVCSLFASYFSSITLLALPADIYTSGSVTLLQSFAFVPASIVISLVYIPIFYRNRFSSVFEYVEVRHGSVLLRKITAIGSACGAIAYSAVCAYVPCVAFNMATGIPEWAIIIAISIITIFYTVVGGLRAVVLVDTIQAVIMFAGVIACLIVGAVKIGGLDLAWQYSYDMGRIAITNWQFEPYITHSGWAMFIGWFIHFTAGIGNNQATLQRCCAMESLTKAKISLLLVSPLVVLLAVILWLTAMVTFTYYNSTVKCDPLTSGLVTSTNQLLPYFVHEIMNYPGFLGAYYACIFSGSISSMSTAYNSVSSLIWEDWLRPILEPRLTKRQILLVIKSLATIVGVLVGIFAILAKYVGGTALKVGISFTGAFTGCVHVVYFCGAFLPFVTSTSLIIGLCISAPLTLAIMIVQVLLKPYTHPWLPMVTSGCLRDLNNATMITSPANFTTTLLDHSDNQQFPPTTFRPIDVSMVTSNNSFMTSAVVDSTQPTAGAYGIFAMSYTYFPAFSMLCCLFIAVVISLISLLLSKYFPDTAWLRPVSSSKLDPKHLAFGFLTVLSAGDLKRNTSCSSSSSSSSSSKDAKRDSMENYEENAEGLLESSPLKRVVFSNDDEAEENK